VKRAVVAGVEISTEHWIAGRRVASRSAFRDVCPIDGSVLADVAAGGAPEVEAAVDAAREAFPAWAALGPRGRQPILKAFAERIRARAKELAAVETTDNGSLLIGNLTRVVPRAAHNIEFFADFALRLEHETIDSDEVVNHVRYEPAGVCAIVTPWNAPLMLTTWKLGPALASGNTAVVKPPEWAPLTGSLLADLAHDAGVPDGVLNVVQGIGEEAGAALVAHRDVARISFTGSTDTGRLIAATAGRRLVPVSVELGGKSPFIVCADADLDAAAQTIGTQYLNAGQVCLAGTRVLAERSIADALLEKVRAAAARMAVGDPREQGTRVGPLITREHFARVSGFVERALAAGAKPLFGGKRHAAGELYFEPTLFANVTTPLEIAQHEVFGPVLTWQTFGDDEECLSLANSTRYGLAAMIYTRDRARAERLARDVVAGTVWVNCFFVRDLAAPFGGARESGIGREGGRWSFDFFCDVKNVAIRRDTLG
jgi:acyl-CoA reductase-like NAD-dependent aldehyde dehydrogenase